MKPSLLICSTIAAVCAIALVSCSLGGRSPSGFLNRYSQLDSGYGTADAVAVYLNPDANLRKYDSVIFDPVTTVVAAPGISAEVKDQLAAYLAESLQAQVPGGMRIVGSPSPTTLRVRAALTDVIEGRKSGKPITISHASPRATLSGRLGSEGIAAFVSTVSFEGEILDSATGERLSALCDHRLGVKREATPDTSWAGVRSATNQGAAKLWKRFIAARGN
jgi:Protein of unknown function (DUF3313)